MITAADIQASFHYLYPQELPALKLLVAQLSHNPLVINIGSGAGTSGLAIMEARRDAMLLTIDIQDKSSPFGCLEAERDVMARAGFGPEFGIRWWQVHGDSSTLGRDWQRNVTSRYPIDVANGVLKRPAMVFVDGDHSYGGCKADIEAWFPLIEPGGIIAVHDYLKQDLAPDPNGPHPMSWPGVDSAVNELLVPNFEMILHVASLVAFRKP